jgi:hypothetical protein
VSFAFKKSESKIPETFASGILVSDSQLLDNDDVARLKALRALFDGELDALSFLQVLETFALNGGEVDKDIIAAIASEEAIALRSIEPLDCTVDTFRHFCLLMANEKYGGYSLGVASERFNSVYNKATHGRSVSQPGISKANYWYPTPQG